MRRRQAFAAQAARARMEASEPAEETLRERYKRVFGVRPHHRLKDETILARLQAHGDAERRGD